MNSNGSFYASMFFFFNIFLFILEQREISRIKGTAFNFKGIFLAHTPKISTKLTVLLFGADQLLKLNLVEIKQ